MGIYDRDYYRGDEQPRYSIPQPTTAVGALIALNVIVYVADQLLASRAAGHWLDDYLSLQFDTLWTPWRWWQFISYGFVHDPRTITHIVLNMMGLFFLAPAVEAFYGRREFVLTYLSLIVAGGLAWAVTTWLRTSPSEKIVPLLMGASAAVTGVVVLFALNFPRQQLLLFFVLPVPAWIVGVLVVGGDMLNQLSGGGRGGSNVAYIAHLGGAAFALVYFQSGMRFERWGRALWSLWQRGARPKLRVHQPPPDRDDEPVEQPGDIAAEVDRILEKISREGNESLTPHERHTLEEASREYQRRMRARRGE